MMDGSISDYMNIASAVQIHSEAHYSIKGHLRSLPMSATSPNIAEAMQAAIQLDVYRELFCRPTPQGAMVQDGHALRDHVAALSHANTGTGSWEEGWRITGLDGNGTIAVRKTDLTFWALPENVRSSQDLVVGALCEVLVPKEMRYLVPGFYMAVGNYDLSGSLPSLDKSPSHPKLVRFYWHLTSEISARFINGVTHLLNTSNIPFRVKVVSNPAMYLRADAGVLYLKDISFDKVVGPLKKLYGDISSGLRASVPMFTKMLAPGLALAEDPGNGESFGQVRCKLVAQALWNSYVRGAKNADERAAEILLEFRSQRIDPALPFLRSGSIDRYAIPLEEGMAFGA
jgi:hypothetical protein